jgi:hypothetical protein
MVELRSDFDFGDRVRIDGGDVVWSITAFSFQGNAIRCSVEVSWFHNGEAKSGFFYEWRLTIATEGG